MKKVSREIGVWVLNDIPAGAAEGHPDITVEFDCTAI